MLRKIIEVDIDGVLTMEQEKYANDLPGSYVYATPNHEMRKYLHWLIDQGCTIMLYTGRSSEQRRLTENWLKLHKFPYHFIAFDKQYCHWRIDDRNITPMELADYLKTGKPPVNPTVEFKMSDVLAKPTTEEPPVADEVLEEIKAHTILNWESADVSMENNSIEQRQGGCESCGD